MYIYVTQKDTNCGGKTTKIREGLHGFVFYPIFKRLGHSIETYKQIGSELMTSLQQELMIAECITVLHLMHGNHK